MEFGGTHSFASPVFIQPRISISISTHSMSNVVSSERLPPQVLESLNAHFKTNICNGDSPKVRGILDLQVLSADGCVNLHKYVGSVSSTLKDNWGGVFGTAKKIVAHIGTQKRQAKAAQLIIARPASTKQHFYRRHAISLLEKVQQLNNGAKQSLKIEFGMRTSYDIRDLRKAIKKKGHGVLAATDVLEVLISAGQEGNLGFQLPSDQYSRAELARHFLSGLIAKADEIVWSRVEPLVDDSWKCCLLASLKKCGSHSPCTSHTKDRMMWASYLLQFFSVIDRGSSTIPLVTQEHLCAQLVSLCRYRKVKTSRFWPKFEDWKLRFAAAWSSGDTERIFKEKAYIQTILTQLGASQFENMQFRREFGESPPRTGNLSALWGMFEMWATEQLSTKNLDFISRCAEDNIIAFISDNPELFFQDDTEIAQRAIRYVQPNSIHEVSVESPLQYRTLPEPVEDYHTVSTITQHPRVSVLRNPFSGRILRVVRKSLETRTSRRYTYFRNSPPYFGAHHWNGEIDHSQTCTFLVSCREWSIPYHLWWQ
eukprot:TRINITY_DN3611_c0_g1_i1.p1 TRINITY_DN3611_c0_g1~~TRINITY_DN3611_c0_g1_i1.p1  ORF type:complete len:629 (-),score=-168.68 TRINITY_DN3611_c0_g1_i1:528-2144(-)